MKLVDIDWDSAPYGSEKLAQFGVLVTWLKEGHYYRVSDDSWARAGTKDFEVLATRPKSPLTNEQIEAVREYDKWQDTTREFDRSVAAWLKQRGGEHD